MNGLFLGAPVNILWKSHTGIQIHEIICKNPLHFIWAEPKMLHGVNLYGNGFSLIGRQNKWSRIQLGVDAPKQEGSFQVPISPDNEK
ncbi:hypothetical protein ACFPES_21665 [Paenibacillus sp. GCM10023248]|uniref:hypothetical protein n=1 Tax=Bacillales TaxID=1385 RepID=UPI0023791F8F|nr:MULTISPECIES: hypothetical protein [Bacillales]MDD9269666.1 hypothetical protein [Paenibacillus sp. MAHUQ-63]MDR6881930.1 hypothetical protein [Bacillus sp. 3255]